MNLDGLYGKRLLNLTLEDRKVYENCATLSNHNENNIFSEWKLNE